MRGDGVSVRLARCGKLGVQELQALPGDAALQQERADLIDLPPAAFEARLEILEILNDWFATIELDCCCEITGPSNHSIGGVRWHEGWTDFGRTIRRGVRTERGPTQSRAAPCRPSEGDYHAASPTSQVAPE